MTVEERFWAKVEKTDSCWLWTAGKNSNGYGAFVVDARRMADGKRATAMSGAHRFAYELAVGPIPEGKILHHRCRNRACVNPDHLEVTTLADHPDGKVAENRAKTHCVHGHEFTEANTYHWGTERRCRRCRADREKRRRDARR